jgi:hypothetical protein
LGKLPDRRGLVVVHGHSQSSRLAHYFLAAPLLRREAVLFLDAANCFNPHRLAAFAHRCHRSPEEFLEQIHLSRAFTCFQLAELIERTPAAARRYRAQHIILTGMPDIFDDEELSAAETRQVFRRSLERLRRWPMPVRTALVFSDAPARPRPLRHWLDRQLQRQATAVYRLKEEAAGLCLLEEKPPKPADGTKPLRLVRPAQQARPHTAGRQKRQNGGTKLLPREENMGRTIATFHQLIEETRLRFAPYRRALRREDQQVFDDLFARVKYYAASGSMEAPWNPLDAIFLTLFLEQQKTLRALEERLRVLENDNAAQRLAAGPLPGTRGYGPVGD